ncbi:C69 family dipeptidase, partial [Adlercreutzia sp.]
MACTTLLVGRHATNDGSTIVARNEDGEDFSFDPK